MLRCHFFSTSRGHILNKLRIYFNKENNLVDEGDELFDYDGDEILVQVQNYEGDRVKHRIQEEEVLLLELRVIQYLIILLLL